MLRRWLIRSFFILLCVLCVSAWFGSYWRPITLVVGYPAHEYVLIPLTNGRIGLEHEADVGSRFRGWGVDWYFSAPIDWRVCDAQADSRIAGFSSYRRGEEWLYSAPLWVLAVPSMLLFGLVWRNTRKLQPGRAFPIQPNTSIACPSTGGSKGK